ncbi:MAG: asparagine synthase (glutamine-hydrolyzing) [Bacilli bacterium]
MCGITGLVHFNGQEIEKKTLSRMMDVITHRGPDDEGMFIEGGVGLGFRRLSIIDLHEGHQPLTNEDGTLWIVFNGEIYNYKYLRGFLQDRGHQFRTESDTEVIIHLYEEYGKNCVNHLRGMFAFAIWNRNTRELFAARDHFGIKPFYYYTDQDKFVFGSEIKSLLLVEEMKREVHTESLWQYLTFQYVPDPNTMYKGIHKLPPAHSIVIKDDGRVEIKKYWDPMFEPEEKPLEEYIEKLRSTLQDSVKHHMQSDVKRGCFLSSGIDSTAIATYMSKEEQIKTFSVGFEGPLNETMIARESAGILGTEHYDHIITQDEYLNVLPKAIWHQDEPVADPSAIALYFVSKLAREHVTVVLSGEGADELFGGYRIYREPYSLRHFDSLSISAKRKLNHLFAKLPGSIYGKNYLLRGTTPLEERFLGNAKLFSEDVKEDILQDFNANNYMSPIEVAAKYYNNVSHLDQETRMQYIDMNLWMPGDILMKADKMTMANSLELRVPFLDKEVFNVARSIPTKYRITEGTTKYVLRKAMEGIIPVAIVNRPKLGFPVPLRNWMMGEFGNNIMERIEASGIDHLINKDYVRTMMENHRNGNGDYARKIWAVYAFAQWHQTFIENDPVSNYNQIYDRALVSV